MLRFPDRRALADGPIRVSEPPGN